MLSGRPAFPQLCYMQEAVFSLVVFLTHCPESDEIRPVQGGSSSKSSDTQLMTVMVDLLRLGHPGCLMVRRLELTPLGSQRFGGCCFPSCWLQGFH